MPKTKLYLPTEEIQAARAASNRMRDRLNQKTFEGMQHREFPDGPLRNKMDWKKTPLFESMVNADIERRQLKLFPEKGKDEE